MATRKPGHVTLVASDNVMTRNLLTIVLQEEGYLVLSAADGYEALELSRNYRGAIDLFLADRKTTRLDDLCARLLEERPDARVLVMLGDDMRGIATPHREKLRQRVRAVLAAPERSEPLVYLAFAS